MTSRSYILATAGHVDHGKSALVRALTGTDPDRLPEEKARGITIDLGFAHLDLASPPSVQPPCSYHVGIVDVPGHEDFVKNMVAGVGSIDLALFVVAADDGWMPQTEEHLQILTYLGVSRAVVALTKIDLVTPEGEQALRTQIREKLAGTAFADAAMVGTSVPADRGFDELKSALADALKDLPTQRDVGKPRLPVDRVFTLKGIGTVVTGTLVGGSLKRGSPVVVRPSGKPAKVRNLQTHNRDAESVPPGSRVALNLPDLAVDGDGKAGATGATIGRGDVVTLADLGAPSDTIDVLLEKTPRAADDPGGAGRPIKDGTLVRMHLGSGDFPGRVYLLAAAASPLTPSPGTPDEGRGEGLNPSPSPRTKGELTPGQRLLAQLRFESGVYAFAGDRFIIRDWPEQHTLAGGVVLDPDARRREFRTAKRRAYLERLAAAKGQAAAYVEAVLSRDGATARSQLLVKSRFAAAEVAEAVTKLAAAGKAVAAGDVVADAAWWQSLRKTAADAIDAEHKAHPEQAGLRLADLRTSVEKHAAAGSPPSLFDALVADLTRPDRPDFTRAGDRIRRTGHRPALPPRLQAAGTRIRAALAAKPFDPPPRKELAPDATAQQALRFLLETGEAVEVGPEVVMSSDAFGKAVEAVRISIRDEGPATVSELKQVLGVSRRIMVPFLEKLDRDGVTLRQGDVRVLRQAKGA